MVDLLAGKAASAGCEAPGKVQVVRAQALFVSTLQSSESPAPDQVRRAVATTLRRRGRQECAAQTAGEYGEHPETAAARMTWALAMVRTVYQSPRRRPRTLLSLARAC
jgi:uncharacterized protein (DUF488 family)